MESVRYNHQTWNPEELGLPSDTEAPWYYNEGNERDQANAGQIDNGIPVYDLNRDFSPNLNFDMNEVDNILNKMADDSIENVNANLYDEIPPAYGWTSDLVHD